MVSGVRIDRAEDSDSQNLNTETGHLKPKKKHEIK
jgi:hypothetical protein